MTPRVALLGCWALWSGSSLAADPVSRDPVSRDPVSRDPVSRDPVSRDPVDSFIGEKVTWSVRYAGANVGTAWAYALPSAEGHLVLEGGAANAPWYGKIYNIDDFVRSTWDPDDGSQRYETRFREGGFHQDQDMVLGDDTVVVQRKQEFDGEWREWTREYPALAGAEDPISAVHRIRLLDDAQQVSTAIGPGWTFQVFSGDKTWPLIVQVIDHDTIKSDALGGEVAVRVLELRTEHEGMLEQRGHFRIWLTDDARRIPVRMVVKTNFGGIRAELSDYEAPTGANGPAVADD